MDISSPDDVGPLVETAPIGIIWIAGMARSASTWAFNVVRLLLHRRSRQVLPQSIIRPESDYIRIANDVASRAQTDRRPIWLFKTHLKLVGPMPGSILICTYRDPRDALVSFQRFMRCGFEAALAAAEEMTRTCDHYRDVRQVPRLDLEYRDITADPSGIIARIARHLRLRVTPAEIDELSRALAKPAVVRLIAANEAAIAALAASSEPIPSERYTMNADGTARVFDPVTGFQSGHVSDYRDGDWQFLLSAEQIRRMEERLGPWLAANGF
jgi:hypothetical protein